MSAESDKLWTLQDAVQLCTAIEAVCPKFGCHVALTGGLLYREGKRKDCDILFYRIRQADKIDKDGLFEALDGIGFSETSGFGWCHKATYCGRDVDCFFPEEDGEGSEAPYPAPVTATQELQLENQEVQF